MLSLKTSPRQCTVQIYISNFIPIIKEQTTTTFFPKFQPKFSVTHPPAILWILRFLTACGLHQRGLYKVNVETIIAQSKRVRDS